MRDECGWTWEPSRPADKPHPAEMPKPTSRRLKTTVSEKHHSETKLIGQRANRQGRMGDEVGDARSILCRRFDHYPYDQCCLLVT